MKLCTHLPSTDAFPSSEAFDAINSSLQSDAAERTDAVKKGNAVFAFTLKNKDGQTESWYIDLKEKGLVAKGEPTKADGLCHTHQMCRRRFQDSTHAGIDKRICKLIFGFQ